MLYPGKWSILRSLLWPSTSAQIKLNERISDKFWKYKKCKGIGTILECHQSLENHRSKFSVASSTVCKKINGWGEQFVSSAGWEVMMSVLQAIPTYLMSYFLIPNNVINLIEEVIRQFWWGSQNGNGIAWVACDQLCAS